MKNVPPTSFLGVNLPSLFIPCFLSLFLYNVLVSMRTNLVSPGISFIYIVSQDPCRKQDGYFPYNRSIFLFLWAGPQDDIMMKRGD